MGRKTCKIICVISFLSFLIILLWFVTNILSFQNALQSSPEVSMIGGSDAPTKQFIHSIIETRILHSPLFSVGILSFALFVISFLILLIKRFHKR